jgi:hypothetical protein
MIVTAVIIGLAATSMDLMYIVVPEQLAVGVYRQEDIFVIDISWQVDSAKLSRTTSTLVSALWP